MLTLFRLTTHVHIWLLFSNKLAILIYFVFWDVLNDIWWNSEKFINLGLFMVTWWVKCFQIHTYLRVLWTSATYLNQRWCHVCSLVSDGFFFITVKKSLEIETGKQSLNCYISYWFFGSACFWTAMSDHVRSSGYSSTLFCHLEDMW